MSAGAFADGLLQPLLAPAHAMLLLALGLLLGQQARWTLPALAFAAALACGLLALALAIGETPAGDVVLISAAVIGLLVALALPLPAIAGAVLAAIAGLALGLNSPPQAVSLGSATAMLAGTWSGGTLMLALVTGGVRRLRRDWQRIVGSWSAASAILVLALRLSRGMLF
jgi:urease accessory protein